DQRPGGEHPQDQQADDGDGGKAEERNHGDNLTRSNMKPIRPPDGPEQSGSSQSGRGPPDGAGRAGPGRGPGGGVLRRGPRPMVRWRSGGVGLQGAAGVLADAFGDVGGGDDAGVGAQAEDQAADPARGRGAQGDAEPAAGQLADVGADVVLG